jgi:N-alpha-acetyl-L-2,4-diaminobutyrate deacetylase
VSVDLDAKGKAFGHLTVPHSRDDSAWGSVQVPIAVIANGDGPTVLFTGGNHGDEYEGPIALMNLARALDPGQLQGTLYVMPALNLPAVRAGRRTSPIDGGNMNRTFPGDPRGGVTQMIADFVYRELVARADAVLDIHSGGKTLSFAPSAIVHRLPDASRMRATLAALEAFAAPYGLVLTELDAEGLLDTVVEEMGKLFLSTELGGGGTATPETVAIAERGAVNLLVHLGLLADAAPHLSTPPRAGRTRVMTTDDPGAFCVSDHDGIVEFLAPLAGDVAEGDLIARVHNVARPAQPPHEYRAACDGVLVARHFPGLIGTGDCLAVVAGDYTPPA